MVTTGDGVGSGVSLWKGPRTCGQIFLDLKPNALLQYLPSLTGFHCTSNSPAPRPPPHQPATSASLSHSPDQGILIGGREERPLTSSGLRTPPVPLPHNSRPGPPRDKDELQAQRISRGVPGVLSPSSPWADRPAKTLLSCPALPLAMVNPPQWEKLSYFPPGGWPNKATCSRQSEAQLQPTGRGLGRASSPVKTDSCLCLCLSHPLFLGGGD